MPIHVPGPELGSSIPFKHLAQTGASSKRPVDSYLNLTAFVDTMTVLVTFLLMSFSASGELLTAQKGLELPEAAMQEKLQQAPILTITTDALTFNGLPMANVSDLMEDQSLEWKIIELFEALKIERTKFLMAGTDNAEDKAKLEGLLILQADKEIDVKIINRVLKTAYAAEYPNIMFAVNQRSRGGGGGH